MDEPWKENMTRDEYIAYCNANYCRLCDIEGYVEGFGGRKIECPHEDDPDARVIYDTYGPLAIE